MDCEVFTALLLNWLKLAKYEAHKYRTWDKHSDEHTHMDAMP